MPSVLRQRCNQGHIGDLPESVPSVNEKRSGAHLLIAYRQTNVALTGQGTIDGQALHFFQAPGRTPPGQTYACRTVIRDVDQLRPNQMLWFCRCQRVLMNGVKLINPPAWTVLLHGCRDVQIRGITCINSPLSRTADGIDIDCCQNVIVSDCIIRTGDNCLTLRAHTRPLDDNPQVCENVGVVNCLFSTPTCGPLSAADMLRVGLGGPILRLRDGRFFGAGWTLDFERDDGRAALFWVDPQRNQLTLLAEFDGTSYPGLIEHADHACVTYLDRACQDGQCQVMLASVNLYP